MTKTISATTWRAIRTPCLPRSDVTVSWHTSTVPLLGSHGSNHSPCRRKFQPAQSHPHLVQCRSLTTSPALLGGRGASHTVDRKRGKTESRIEKQMIQESQSKQSSLRVRMREMFRSDEVPEDLGLFPATLIMPTGPDVPGLLTVARLRMEYRRLIKRGKDFFSVIMMKWALGFRKHKIQFRKTTPNALALHRQVYSALADGDEGEVRKVATDGVKNKLINKIQARPEDTVYYWDLVKYIGWPRVVSHRATQMPIPDESDDTTSMIRQAVVRIKSIQRLTREDSAEDVTDEKDPVKPQETERNVTEYIVIQKRVLHSVEEPWKFWGTVEPTKLEDFEDALDVKVPPAPASS